jgi:hypothetical protein
MPGPELTPKTEVVLRRAGALWHEQCIDMSRRKIATPHLLEKLRHGLYKA